MIIINILGISLIALIIWWFWIFKTKEVSIANHSITVLIENGSYQPSTIKLPAGQPSVVEFLRKDASPCAAYVLIPDIEITLELPLNKPVSIELPAMKSGEHPFHCQMQMYRGTFVVE